LDYFLGFELTNVGIALTMASATFGERERLLRLKTSMTGEGEPCPFRITSWHLPYNWEKARKTSVNLAELLNHSLHRLGCRLRASVSLLRISSPRLYMSDFNQASVGASVFQVAEIRGSTYPLSVSALMWPAKNSILWNLPAPTKVTSDPCPQLQRFLCCASLGSAVPGGYCHTLTVGDRTSEARVELSLAHTTLNPVGPDRVSKRRISCVNGGCSKSKAHELEF
jgi:hypothetical protein